MDHLLESEAVQVERGEMSHSTGTEHRTKRVDLGEEWKRERDVPGKGFEKWKMSGRRERAREFLRLGSFRGKSEFRFEERH